MLWGIIAMSVAFMAIFCIAMLELLAGKPAFEEHRVLITACLASAGIVAWLTGSVLARRRASVGLVTEKEKGFLLFELRYWGPMLLAFAVVTLTIRPVDLTRKEGGAPPPRPLAPEKAPARTPIMKPTPPKAPVVFPELKLQGIFYRDGKSMVIIDGKGYYVGDRVRKARIQTIERDGVVLELKGETKRLRL